MDLALSNEISESLKDNWLDFLKTQLPILIEINICDNPLNIGHRDHHIESPSNIQEEFLHLALLPESALIDVIPLEYSQSNQEKKLLIGKEGFDTHVSLLVDSSEDF